jgi:hypothetical protein
VISSQTVAVGRISSARRSPLDVESTEDEDRAECPVGDATSCGGILSLARRFRDRTWLSSR